MFVLKMI